MKKTLKYILTAAFLLVAILFSNNIAKVYAASKKPATPKNFKGTVTIDENYFTICKVTWSKVSGADGYEVYVRYQVPGGEDDEWEPWYLLEDTKKTSSSCSIIDGVFQMKVRAYTKSGSKKTYSSYTDTISVLGGVGIISGGSDTSSEKKSTEKKSTEKISISKSSLTMAVNTTYSLSVKGTDKTVKWSSSDTKIAKVSSKGKITALKTGSCTITAKVDGKKYTCKLTVKDLLKNIYGDWFWMPTADSFLTISKSNALNSYKQHYSNTRGEESTTVVKFNSCIEDKDGNIYIYSQETLGNKTYKYKTIFYKDGSYICDGALQKGVKYGKSKTLSYNEKTKKYEDDDVTVIEWCWIKTETLNLN